MTKKAWGNEYRTTTVCIDSYENSVPKGRFYNRYLPEGKTFQSVTQFLLKMEQTLDDMDFPKAYTTTRTFASPVEYETGPPGPEFRMGDEATFTIRILFRQNASWQGSVTWVEGKQEQSFRSVLELILLIDNALSYAKAS